MPLPGGGRKKPPNPAASLVGGTHPNGFMVTPQLAGIGMGGQPMFMVSTVPSSVHAEKVQSRYSAPSQIGRASFFDALRSATRIQTHQ